MSEISILSLHHSRPLWFLLQHVQSLILSAILSLKSLRARLSSLQLCCMPHIFFVFACVLLDGLSISPKLGLALKLLQSRTFKLHTSSIICPFFNEKCSLGYSRASSCSAREGLPLHSVLQILSASHPLSYSKSPR